MYVYGYIPVSIYTYLYWVYAYLYTPVYTHIHKYFLCKSSLWGCKEYIMTGQLNNNNNKCHVHMILNCLCCSLPLILKCVPVLLMNDMITWPLNYQEPQEGDFSQLLPCTSALYSSRKRIFYCLGQSSGPVLSRAEQGWVGRPDPWGPQDPQDRDRTCGMWSRVQVSGGRSSAGQTL